MKMKIMLKNPVRYINCRRFKVLMIVSCLMIMLVTVTGNATAGNATAGNATAGNAMSGYDGMIDTEQDSENDLSLVKEIYETDEMGEYLGLADEYFRDHAGMGVEEIMRAGLRGDFSPAEFVKRLFARLVIDKDVYKRMAAKLIFIGLCMSICHALGSISGFDGGDPGIYYVTYLMVMSVMLGAFTDAFRSFLSLIDNISAFLKCFVPVYALGEELSGKGQAGLLVFRLLMLIIGAGSMQMIIWLAAGIRIYLVLSVINSILEQSHFDSFLNMIRRGVTSSIRTGAGLFMGVGVLERLLEKSPVNKFGVRLAARLVPVFGRTASDIAASVRQTFGAVSAMVGVCGMLVILSVCLLPVIKIFLYEVMFMSVAALLEPVADPKLVKLINNAAGCAGMLLRLSLMPAILFIICLAVAGA